MDYDHDPNLIKAAVGVVSTWMAVGERDFKGAPDCVKEADKFLTEAFRNDTGYEATGTLEPNSKDVLTQGDKNQG